MGGDRRVGSIELPTLGHRQQPGVEAGGVPDREKLLWIGAGSALAAELFWDGQLDGEPAVRGPAVTGSPSFDHRLGCVQDVHIGSLTWKTTRFSTAQATAASARSCCGTGPSRWPPSAMNSYPVENLASSEATNSTRRVISSDSAMRGIAKSLTAPAPIATASDPATIGVRTLPGWMELTRMLSRASSRAAVLVIPRTPHLLATYAPAPNVPVIPAPEEILTIAPPPALRIEDTTARIPRYEPVRLMSITWRQAAGAVSAISPKRTMAALLISTETGPKASSAAATVAAQSASLVTSRREKIARSPTNSASVRPSCSSTSAITTFAPSATKPRAWLAPIPRAPPVTITVRLSKRFMTLLLFNEGLRELEDIDVYCVNPAKGPATAALETCFQGLHLCETAIDKQFRSRDVAAVVGCEKHHGLRDLIGCAEPAERNTVGNGLHVFLGRFYRMPWRRVGIARAHRVHANAT